MLFQSKTCNSEIRSAVKFWVQFNNQLSGRGGKHLMFADSIRAKTPTIAKFQATNLTWVGVELGRDIDTLLHQPGGADSWGTPWMV